jgi:small multidrug resistance pump
MNTGWPCLALSVTAEVVAVYALKQSNGMARWLPTALMFAAFGISVWTFSISMRTLPLGLVYAVWAGGSTALVTLTGMLLFHERVTVIGIISMALIVAGIVGLHVSESAS